MSKNNTVHRYNTMYKYNTEEAVLNEVGIPDFQSMRKKNFPKFMSIYNEINPDIVMKALEQFPEFMNSTKDMLTQYKKILSKSMKSNSTT